MVFKISTAVKDVMLGIDIVKSRIICKWTFLKDNSNSNCLLFVCFHSAQKLDQLKMLYMEDKVKELTAAVQDARNRNAYLQRLLKDAVEKR